MGMDETRIANWLGLACRAGEIVTGDQACMAEIRKGKAKLVIIASDTGSNTKKKYRDKCMFYKIPFVEILSKEVIGHALGKFDRAVVVIKKEDFARSILLELEEQIGGELIE